MLGLGAERTGPAQSPARKDRSPGERAGLRPSAAASSDGVGTQWGLMQRGSFGEEGQGNLSSFEQALEVSPVLIAWDGRRKSAPRRWGSGLSHLVGVQTGMGFLLRPGARTPKHGLRVVALIQLALTPIHAFPVAC